MIRMFVEHLPTDQSWKVWFGCPQTEQLRWPDYHLFAGNGDPKKHFISHMQPTPHAPNSLLRWCAPPHTVVMVLQRSGPRWRSTGMLCSPVVNCWTGGGPSRRFGCGVWSRRMSCPISRITPLSERHCPSSKKQSPKEPSLQVWLLTCFSKPSHHPHSNQRHHTAEGLMQRL